MQFNIQEILNNVPKEFINFVLVTVFSLIIGLSQRKIHQTTEEHRLIGTDRTFTFIGILGYILLIADPVGKRLFLGGGAVIAAFLLVYYFFKIQKSSGYGLTTILIAIITYCISLLLITQPFWLFLLVLVTVLIFTELKETFTSISEKIDRHEFVTLAKFLIMAGLILPIVPDKVIVSAIPVTPFHIWLAVVVISSISYISYLLKKFVFKDAGIVISGILGGLYSSTATTVVLSRKLKDADKGKKQYLAAIILATCMMYFRVLLLVFVFSKTLFSYTLPVFLILIAVSAITAGVLIFKSKNEKFDTKVEMDADKNPLEFKAAIIFTLIFVLFSFLTQYSLNRYGHSGLNGLSLIVGVVDIDPFLLNIFQGKFDVTVHFLALASFQAIISNNVAKAAYACFFSGKKYWIPIIIMFLIIIAVNIILLFFL
jgi:uncharacterized membrane protein (DUF4010 family)